ncbi:hypothetical protein [Fimbriimonas ginsengisoli]|uniref:Uncharacterized protein n=1 Tax=Fimbriimonas ginsengisoli Gsoil 348 TaxID=661478 RepID=A0A068NLR9_FIMGI|nr:hypothetical protein [Fimbriimonas ginsengisoli]AIE83710.1 hypothetical protein OP10G_0342 [Fimbriimonas ginsengisoli Gsoil 348]
MVTLACAIAAGAFGQEIKAPIKRGQRPILVGQQRGLSVRDSLVARPKVDTPAPSPNGRPGKLDDTSFSSTASVSWRSAAPAVEFKLNGAGPFPKTGTFEVYAIAPALTNAPAGAGLSSVNQIKATPPELLYKIPITTGQDGTFTVNFGAFAPKAKGNAFALIGKPAGAAVDGESSSAAKLAVAKIQALGYTRYYARVVNPKGASSTNACIEYGEALPSDVSSNLRVKTSNNANPWLTTITSTLPVYSLKWWTLAPGASSAVFQLSQKPFSDDPRTWRLSGLGHCGPVPAGSSDGINLFGLSLANYLVGGPRAKGDYYLRVVPLKPNGDLAAQPSNEVLLHLVAADATPLASTQLEIWTNSAFTHGETAEKPIWGSSTDLSFLDTITFRWSTKTNVTKANVLVRRIDDWSNDVVNESTVNHQGPFALDIKPLLLPGRFYEIKVSPVDSGGKPAAEEAKVFINVSAQGPLQGLPTPKQPPTASFNCFVTVDHYEPLKLEEPYRYVLAREPNQGTIVDDEMYKFFAALTNHPSPHQGDKIYLPPKPDNGKSWSDYVSDGVNFVASIATWAEGAASSLNSYYDQVKQSAAEGISSATGIPVEIVKFGIEIACDSMGVPSNPMDFGGMTSLGSDYLAGEILDATGAGDALRDQASGLIQSGLTDMAKQGTAMNDPSAPMIIPDPDFAAKPSIMRLRVKYASSDSGAYGGGGPVTIRVESWYSEDQNSLDPKNTPKEHVVLYESTIVLPKMKAGQVLTIPVALRPTKLLLDEPGRWWKAYNMSKETWFTVDGTVTKDRLCSKAWP